MRICTELCEKNVFETKIVKGGLSVIPYLVLMFVPLLFSFVRISKNDGKNVIAIGGKRGILNNSCALPVFFIILIVLLSLRDVSIGRDLMNYKSYFEQISVLSLKEIFRVEVEGLYLLLNWIVSRFTRDFQVLLSIIAVITTLPIAMVYCQDRKHGFLKIVLLMNMSTFVLLFSGLRQSIAIAIALIAYKYVKEKNLVKFLLTALIALGFHHSAFIIFTFYPLYHITLKKKHLWGVVPSVFFVFIFNKPIFNFATMLLGTISEDKYTAEIESTGAYSMLILFIVFAAFSYLFPHEKMMDQETLGLRNFLLVAVFFQCFAPIHMLAMRMNYYFIIFIPILIPKLLRYRTENEQDFILLAKSVLIVFFVGYYLITTYTSCKTGISALDIYPYVPFWK